MDSEENGLRQGNSVSILQLPNEILHDILSFVLADTGSPEDESPRKFLFVINEVCPLFRDIAATLPFWYEPDFDFLSLYSPPPGKPGSNAQKRIFLKTLFQNSQLVETLQSRTDWIVHDSRILRTIVQCLPSFHHSAVSLTFTCIHLKAAIGSQLIANLLKPCRRLKSVTFGVDCETANLNKITRSVPNLERLEIASPHRDWYSRYTLNELTCLREFRCNAGVGEAWLSEEVLPLKSVGTLTSLHLNLYVNPFDWRQAYQYHHWTEFLSSLSLFVNLKSLHVSPLTDDIALFLADKLGVTFKLLSFSTTLVTLSPTATTQAVSRMTMFLDKADFSTVKEFTFVIHQGKLKGERWKTYTVKPIVEAIVKSLTHIQRLELDMPFDREWCRDFTAMTNLRELVWTTDDNSVFDSGEEPEATVGPALGEGDRSSEAEVPQCEIQREEMKAGLVKAFEDFREVPKMVLDVRGDRFMSSLLV